MTIQDWLGGPDKDQEVVGIESLSNILQNQAGRKWWKSQIIRLFVHGGHFIKRTGRFRMGSAPIETTGVPDAELTTDAGSATLTAPAGSWLFLNYMHAITDRAADYSIVYTPAASGSNLTLLPAGVVNPLADVLIQFMGAQNVFSGNTDNLDPFWLAPGDSITISENNYVAGDTNEYAFRFIEYEV